MIFRAAVAILAATATTFGHFLVILPGIIGTIRLGVFS